MIGDSGLLPKHQLEDVQYSTSSAAVLDKLSVPKPLSTLRNARSGNSLTLDLSDLNSKFDAHVTKSWCPAQDSTASSDDDSDTYCSSPESVRRRPAWIDLSSAKNAVFTPPHDVSGANTPDTSASKAIPPFSIRKPPYDLITPTKRRAVSYGAVVDTPPSSNDRFIPSRSRADASIGNYRTNKPFFELTPDQKQMRLDGTVADPFMARKVTPQHNSYRNASTGRLPQSRAVSANGVWGVGGSATQHHPTVRVDDGRGGVLGSGTNARLFNSDFFNSETPQESRERFEGRLAMALDLDQSGKVLDFNLTANLRKGPTKAPAKDQNITRWRDGRWTNDKPKQVLDAPCLKDDYYCALLAYCPVAKILAVGLRDKVYLWSETQGVHKKARADPEGSDCYVTSVSFSSPGAGRSILAIGRSNGRVSLWSAKEEHDRIRHPLPAPIASVAFKPVPTRHFSVRIGSATTTEELLIGDEIGNVYYYSIEWPEQNARRRPTSMILLAKLSLHKQQVCGLVWSPDGEFFATGGNDNACYFLAVRDVLLPGSQGQRATKVHYPSMSPYASNFIPNKDAHHIMSPRYGTNEPHLLRSRGSAVSSQNSIPHIGPERARHRWQHAAAVKAIAFCPWQKGLIATGGGSNDRAIHFFHTTSGACLATIDVYAQVTSLIWSKTRREICATLGYASPEHLFRIVVFSWPDCRQVVRVPWTDGNRALYAIPYPGGPNEENKNSNLKLKGKSKVKNSEGGTWWSRTKEEGCIVVATSDSSVKFHEVWSGKSSGMGASSGGLGWSRILESEEGGDIDFGGENVIR